MSFSISSIKRSAWWRPLLQLSLPTRFGVAEDRWAAAERGAAAVITAAATAAAQAAPPSSDHHLDLFSGTHWTETTHVLEVKGRRLKKYMPYSHRLQLICIKLSICRLILCKTYFKKTLIYDKISHGLFLQNNNLSVTHTKCN